MERQKSISNYVSSTPSTPDYNESSSALFVTSPAKSSSTPSRPSTPISSNNADKYTCQPDLEELLSSLTIHEKSEERMFRTLANIFRSVQQERLVELSNTGPENVWIALQRANVASQRGIQDLEALRRIRNVLDQLLWNNSRLLVPTAKALADGSRDAIWRTPFGEAGILDFFLNLITTDNVPEDLLIQALRLIGNTCGDNDGNRERVITFNHLQFIVQFLETPNLASLAVSVIYNICSEHEPAKALAKKDGLIAGLVHVLENDTVDNSHFLGHLCRLLDLFSDNLDSVDQSPEQSVEVFLAVASNPSIEFDNYVSLVEAAVAHLKHDSFQRRIVVEDLLDLPLKLLAQSYTPPRTILEPQTSGSAIAPPPSRDPPEEEQVTTMRNSLIQVLSDVSALPEYGVRYASMDSPHTNTLRRWLKAPHAQLQLCSCIMLGNLARSDQTCQALVSQVQVHKELINILRTSKDTQVLFSTLGFLRNLALPIQNKDILGEANVVAAAAKFWTTDVLPYLAQTAVGLARQVINSSLPNVRRILASLSSDEESPAHSKTYLSLMLLLFDKSDDTTIKVEISRTIAAILRTIHSSSQQDQMNVDNLLERLFSLHDDIGKPLAMMVSQSRWPIIRSEGWFAMALMARSTGGSAAIEPVLQEIEVFGALEATVRGEAYAAEGIEHRSLSILESETPTGDTGEAGSQQTQNATMAGRDRENAMVLVNEILRNRGNQMSDVKRSVLEDLLHGRRTAASDRPN